MKFEDPIMNISMFEMENVIAASGVESTDVGEANSYVDDLIKSAAETGSNAVKVTITF